MKIFEKGTEEVVVFEFSVHRFHSIIAVNYFGIKRSKSVFAMSVNVVRFFYSWKASSLYIGKTSFLYFRVEWPLSGILQQNKNLLKFVKRSSLDQEDLFQVFDDQKNSLSLSVDRNFSQVFDSLQPSFNSHVARSPFSGPS